MKKQLTLVAVASLLMASHSFAQTPSYNYVEGGLALYPGATDADQTFIGPTGRGAMELEELTGIDNLFAYGGLTYLTDDFDYTNFHAGIGYAHFLDAQTSVWGGGNIEYQKLSFSGFSSSDTSIALRGGIRHQLNQDLEVGGGLRLVTGDWDYLGLSGTARYQLQDNLYALAEVDIWDGDVGVIGGVGMTF
ncbi:hypothetical protein SAMN05660443_2469 [Marinospirillum celere]|uniref:Outer membrane protein beta-barrel domain-containing protein n=1 Tax=Marinospirillum celere TaxID=1122252 RepID=A0A1I1IRG0_9GAMM|nr:hypothetical protein [Marinospirillum celere]SFC38815.1 hypothetical protein SAMN05660443_2469 [Marinospirillum celere]